MALMKPPRSGVRVRMYNPGFGDCFLLAFRGPDKKTVYVMIDCGVHGSFKGGSDQIREVLRDIRGATGGKIDLIVVTHEHADHVSGFYLGREIFAGEDHRGRKDPDGGIEVEQVWFGWTENPRSRKAKRLDKVKKLLLQGLYAAPQAMSADENNSVRSMLGFYAMDTGSKRERQLPLGADVFGVSTREAREKLRLHAKKSTYLKPKQAPISIPGVDKVRVFVLGPPEDEKFLLSPNPTGEEGEVFEGEEGHALRFDNEEALVAGLAAAGRVPAAAGDTPSSERYQPFSGNHRRHLDKVRAR
ncbi:MAG: MBL fold metallo-hydrolase, partial [Thermoanaerobaculia bacterium]